MTKSAAKSKQVKGPNPMHSSPLPIMQACQNGWYCTLWGEKSGGGVSSG